MKTPCFLKKSTNLLLYTALTTATLWSTIDAVASREAAGTFSAEATTTTTFPPLAQKGQKAFSAPRLTLNLVDEMTVMLQHIGGGYLTEKTKLGLTNAVLDKASLKEAAALLQEFKPMSPYIQNVFASLDSLSAELEQPANGDTGAFRNGTSSPIRHATVLLNRVIRSSMEESVRTLEVKIAALIAGEAVRDASIRHALIDLRDAAVAGALMAIYATQENLLWERFTDMDALFANSTWTVPTSTARIMERLFGQRTVNSALTVEIQKAIIQMLEAQTGPLDIATVRTKLSTLFSRPEINDIPLGELQYFFRTFCSVKILPLSDSQKAALFDYAFNLMNLAAGLSAQLASDQDLVGNNLMGELFPIIPPDMPEEELLNIPSVFIIE